MRSRDLTPQERLVQAINDNQALALIIADLFDKDDVRQEYLSHQLVWTAERLKRALASWQKELAADDGDGDGETVGDAA